MLIVIIYHYNNHHCGDGNSSWLWDRRGAITMVTVLNSNFNWFKPINPERSPTCPLHSHFQIVVAAGAIKLLSLLLHTKLASVRARLDF